MPQRRGTSSRSAPMTISFFQAEDGRRDRDVTGVQTCALPIAGIREASGIPVAVVAAGYVGFGALAADYGIPVGITVLSTVAIWALPGQLILVEMHTLGAPFVALLLSVVLSSARFLP